MKPVWHRVSETDGTGFLQGVRSVEVELRDGPDSPETWVAAAFLLWPPAWNISVGWCTFLRFNYV